MTSLINLKLFQSVEHHTLIPKYYSTKLNLRGGAFVDVVAALGVMGAILIILINDYSFGFQPNPHVIVPPHLQWLYENNCKPGQFGYGKGADWLISWIREISKKPDHNILETTYLENHKLLKEN